MSILIKGIPLGGYEISIMKDGERYRARVDGIWCEVEEIQTTDTDSDTISRKAAIEALKRDMASIDHIIKGMSVNDVRLDAYVSQRNQVNYDIYTINNLPPVQPVKLGTNLAEVGTDCISRQAAIDALVAETIYTKEELKEYYEANSHRDEWVNGIYDAVEVIEQLPPAPLAPDQNGDLWITVPDIDKVTRIYVQESKSKFCRIFCEEQEQPEPYVGHWTVKEGELAFWDVCSVCRKMIIHRAPHYNFCPNCGAEMEVTE